MDLEERITISIPSINEIQMWDFENTPSRVADSRRKKYEEWVRNSCVSTLTITVEGKETANRIKEKIEECAKTEYDGRLQMAMELAGVEGDCEGFLVFSRITVLGLKVDEATQLSDTIKNFLLTQRNTDKK